MKIYTLVTSGIFEKSLVKGSIAAANVDGYFGNCNCILGGNLVDGCNCFVRITILDAPDLDSVLGYLVSVYTERIDETPSDLIRERRYILKSDFVDSVINNSKTLSVTWNTFLDNVIDLGIS